VTATMIMLLLLVTSVTTIVSVAVITYRNSRLVVERRQLREELRAARAFHNAIEAYALDWVDAWPHCSTYLRQELDVYASLRSRGEIEK